MAGSSALRAALQRRLADECSSLLGEDFLTIFWDLEKFYDHVNLQNVDDIAARVDYPLMPLSSGSGHASSP